jgi:hypothetical protein
LIDKILFASDVSVHFCRAEFKKVWRCPARPADDRLQDVLGQSSARFARSGSAPVKGFTMSSISSISGAGQGLYQFLQGISGVSAAQGASPASAAASTASTSSTSAGTETQGSHRHHKHGAGDLFKQIQDAVSSALQSTQSSGSSDPNKTIEDAIAKVLANNTAGAQPANGNTTAGASDSDGDGSAGSTSQTGVAANPARQAFDQALQSHGVSPQQFHQDLLAAIKDAQGGQFDPSAAFKSFPPGSLVDLAA